MQSDRELQEASTETGEPRKSFAAVLDRRIVEKVTQEALTVYERGFARIVKSSPVYLPQMQACIDELVSPVVIRTGIREIRADEIDKLINITPSNQSEAEKLSKELMQIIEASEEERGEISKKIGLSKTEIRQGRKAIHDRIFLTPAIVPDKLNMLIQSRMFCDRLLNKLRDVGDEEVVVKSVIKDKSGERTFAITAKELREVIYASTNANKEHRDNTISLLRYIQNNKDIQEVNSDIDLGESLKHLDRKEEVAEGLQTLIYDHQRPVKEKMMELSKKDILVEIEKKLNPNELNNALPKNELLQKQTNEAMKVEVLLKLATKSAKKGLRESQMELRKTIKQGDTVGQLKWQLEIAKLDGVVRGISDIRTHLKGHASELILKKNAGSGNESRKGSSRLSTSEVNSRSSVRASDATPSVSRRTSASSENDFRWKDEESTFKEAKSLSTASSPSLARSAQSSTPELASGKRRDSFDASVSSAVAPATAPQSRHKLSNRRSSTELSASTDTPRAPVAASWRKSEQKIAPAAVAPASGSPRDWAVSNQVKKPAGSSSTDQVEGVRSRSPSFSSGKQ